MIVLGGSFWRLLLGELVECHDFLCIRLRVLLASESDSLIILLLFLLAIGYCIISGWGVGDGAMSVLVMCIRFLSCIPSLSSCSKITSEL